MYIELRNKQALTCNKEVRHNKNAHRKHRAHRSGES